MYAAAGGASLASRQARQKQRQNKKAQQLKNQKASELLPKAPQLKQFHNYTDQGVPKLSRVERNALKPPTNHERRHSTSNYHLKEPRTRIRESPSICIPVQNHLNQNQQQQQQQQQNTTGGTTQPLTPCTLVQNHLTIPQSPSIQSQLPQIFIPEGEKGLERRCSFVRQVEEMEKRQQVGVLDRCNHICNFEIKDKGWDNNPAFFAEYDKTVFGSLDYPFSECSQGRAAWQERERGRRCSLSEEARQHRLKQTEAHHRWMKRNRIHDTTYGGSSDEEDFFNVYHQSAAANALLYVGLGTVAIGSVIFFVGTGEKGFKTLELRLIGPTLIACGLLCCLIRVLLCACPSSTCIRRRKKTRLKNACPHNNNNNNNSNRYPLNSRVVNDRRNDFLPLDRTYSNRQKKKVCIAPGGNNSNNNNNNNNPIPSTSTMNFQEATASATFTYNEEVQQQQQQQRDDIVVPLKPSIPIITVPDFADFNNDTSELKRDDSLIELQNLEDTHYELQSVSSCDSDTIVEIETRKLSKHIRSREPAFNLIPPTITSTTSATSTSTGTRTAATATGTGTTGTDQTLALTTVDINTNEYDEETCLSVVIEQRIDNNNSCIKNIDNNNKTGDKRHDSRGNGNGSGTSAIDTDKLSHSGIVLSPLQLGQ